MLTLLLLPLKALHWEEYQLLGRMRPVIFFCPFYLPINKSCSTTAAIFYKLEKIGLPKKCLEFFKLCNLRPFCNAKSHAVKIQYGNFRIFLSLRFYVKSILDNLKVLKLPFLPILRLWILLIWWFSVFGKCKNAQKSKFRVSKCVKMADFAVQE